tara:strand:+ start:923 stop:1120 length:198 start_codon:yes stop_codon:yes gene_type:complete
MKIQGVQYKINWNTLKVGWSFFLPCTDTKGAAPLVKEEAKKFRYKVVCRSVIEGKLRGLRFWRIE